MDGPLAGSGVAMSAGDLFTISMAGVQRQENRPGELQTDPLAWRRQVSGVGEPKRGDRDGLGQ
ncbi:hypothetical protein [Rhodanobacter hydrolyticus]|uniref:Uncharacterized protein n=1 Tax=Rhodanobacter hydrolyticus TaxID=2250595 RepID=A0ABW8J986_9GAMM